MRDNASKRLPLNPEICTALQHDDAYIRRDAPAGQLALRGPCPVGTIASLPIRGDLAHIRLAGICFVPHYAAPMPHRAGSAGAVLRSAPQADGEALCVLQPGERFDVLDIAGGWCWGEAGVGGAVGYVEQAALEADAP